MRTPGFIAGVFGEIRFVHLFNFLYCMFCFAVFIVCVVPNAVCVYGLFIHDSPIPFLLRFFESGLFIHDSPIPFLLRFLKTRRIAVSD